MKENFQNHQSDADVQRLGLEVARFLKESGLTTTWVRSESHFGDLKFAEFKKGT